MIIAKRRILFLFISVVLFLSDPSLAADRLRISYSGPSISNALLWVTKEGKLFEKNGLDVEVIYLAGSLGQSALIAGETQFAVYTGLLMTPARLQGARHRLQRRVLHVRARPPGRSRPGTPAAT